MRKVDEYIEQLPEALQEAGSAIRQMILDLVPAVEERWSFKIPFYHYHGMFMYLNKTDEGLDVAFCRGKDLVDTFPQLETRNRAMVASVCIRNRKDIRRLALREMILTAAAWNEEASRLKIPMVNKKGPKKGPA